MHVINQKKLELNQQGFTVLDSVLTEIEVDKLVTIAGEMLSKTSYPRSEFAQHRSGNVWKFGKYVDSSSNLVIDVLGENAEFDKLMSIIFEHPNVKSLLEMLHGDQYKVTQVNIRQVLSGDTGLNFHQDSQGETGIGILLNECRDNQGTTVFIAGSHRWPFSIRELFVYPRILINLIPKKWVIGANGKAGDMYFFINQAWHGRPAFKKPGNTSTILISIFGSQSEYKIHEMPEEKLNTMPPIMKSLIDHRAGLTYLSDGLVKINRSEKLEGIMPDGIYNTNDPSSGWKLLQPWISLSRFIAAVLRRK
jgi:putative 2OG-Fe(II) oxygenase